VIDFEQLAIIEKPARDLRPGDVVVRGRLVQPFGVVDTAAPLPMGGARVRWRSGKTARIHGERIRVIDPDSVVPDQTATLKS
jgi:hypothetical protein